ncbi:hypothetical protein [Halovivax limisalsi]|uniref:hypothetical protein n=1 Tax=Halovivax limisalsi TaxID=1453760 RepID=UPI001FFD0CBF|nr:hypothetical protein [Halovivax limisalsi]
MMPQITNDGKKILSAIEQKLGRSPSSDEMETVRRILEEKGFLRISQGATTRYVFALPNDIIAGTDRAVLKIPGRRTDFFESYSLEHLGADQNIRSVYTAEYLSKEGLAPPIISYSELGSWVVYPFLDDLSDEHMDEFEQKVDEIKSINEVSIATQREMPGTADIEIPESWGVYEGEVVLRDLASVVISEDKAPELDLVKDPLWESH